MPSKVKVTAGSAGFLKPTFSSRSKVVEKGENKTPRFWTKEQNETNKKPPSNNYETHKVAVRKMDAIHKSPLHSSVSTIEPNSSSKIPESNAKPEENEKEDFVKKKHENLSLISNIDTAVASADLENEIKIRDARRACDELRSQIEELKYQQKSFHSRLSVEFKQLNVGNGKPKVDARKMSGNGNPVLSSEPDVEFQNCPKNKEEQIGNKIQETESLPKDIPGKVNKIQKSYYDKDSSLTEDSFNLHGSVTSSDITDFVSKDEWLGSREFPGDIPPTRVIKRLIAERERYKKKVKHLQTALHRLKKQTSSDLSCSPDIAARDIVYFNADLIGEGCLSYVYSGTIYKNQKAAIKKLIRPDMMSTSDRSYLAAEAGLLMALHHPNIVQVFGVSAAPLQPLIITELVKGRSLHDRLHTSDGWPLSPVKYYSAVLDVAVGMAYLHGQKPPVLHLNLRPCNVLIDMSGRAKVADFGFSKIRLDAGISNMSNLAYMAPELLQFPVHLTTKLDVFSFGIVMWEMATMSKPHKKSSAYEILEVVSSGKRLNIPSELPSALHAIISRCWDHSPMQRPSFKEIIILLKTMNLPEEWNEAMKHSDLSRADAKDLITPRDHVNATVESGGPSTAEAPQTIFVKSNETIKKYGNDETSERRKLSNELAVESDMMTHGYFFPKANIARNDSANYLKGFERPNMLKKHNPFPNRKHMTPSHHRSLASRLSPYKYSLMNVSPVVPPYYSESSMHSDGIAEATPPGDHTEAHIRYKAARNLNQELAVYTESQGFPKVVSRRGTADSASTGWHRHSEKVHHHANSNGHPVKPKSGSQSSSETDASLHAKNAKGPTPLTDRDLRYHNQDLTVETPKVFTRRSYKNAGKSKPVDYSSPRSPEDLRTAVSIPYLKNLHSGDEISSASGNGINSNRSHFDEKLGPYISEACHAESRNIVNAQMKGWRCDRSTIFHKQPDAPPSDNVKVRSITSTVHQGYGDGGRRIVSSAISESPETIMTAVYKPDETERNELHQSGHAYKYNDLISPTLSENTLNETRRIGVLSIPSTSGTHLVTSKHRQTSGGSRRMDPNSHPIDHHKILRRENSWNKLKNSYSPEPIMPHFTSPFDVPPCPGNIILPPALNGAEIRDVSSAFTRLVPHHSKHTPKSNKKNKMSRNAEKTMREVAPAPSNWVHRDEVDHDSTSTMSSAANDEVVDTLEGTARELSEVSEMLESAVKQHKQSLSREKTKK